MLIGDAVHDMAPNLGRCACETIFDAATLAGELARVDDPRDLAPAFENYRRTRRAKAYRIATASRVMCRLGMLTRGTSIRNLLPRLGSSRE